jgi:hypothetical protein
MLLYLEVRLFALLIFNHFTDSETFVSVRSCSASEVHKTLPVDLVLKEKFRTVHTLIARDSVLWPQMLEVCRWQCELRKSGSQPAVAKLGHEVYTIWKTFFVILQCTRLSLPSANFQDIFINQNFINEISWAICYWTSRCNFVTTLRSVAYCLNGWSMRSAWQ